MLPRRGPSVRSRRALDWFVFFLADVQTGFGPFIAVYLTTQKWTQVEIGMILSVSGLVALLGQIPGGALVDWARSEQFLAGLAVGAIGLSALAYAAWPIFPVVLSAAILQAAASCVLGPVIAAISLGLVGRSEISRRLGRNARFASIGSGLAAAGMGACGYFLSSQSVFFVTVLLTIPTVLAVARIRADEINPELAHGAVAREEGERTKSIAVLTKNRPLLEFALVLLMFRFANAAMLPLLGSAVTMQSSTSAPALIAACMVMPQIVVAAMSPWTGVRAQTWGRRPLLLIGIGALVLRSILLALIHDPPLLVLIQILDGVSASVFGSPGTACCCRCHLWVWPLQCGTRNGRNRHRYWRLDQYAFCRLCLGPLWRRYRISHPWGSRSHCICFSLVCNARNAPRASGRSSRSGLIDTAATSAFSGRGGRIEGRGDWADCCG